ncbi:alpha/beta hydrolase family protein [Acidisoma cladoniae]|uniref:alpha/beta hydrolase family protein n=1 Tax=Acidisoma cladoniae TaxID=3040935 RepID=UPI00254C42AF|nr:hypothetical protein [Acidisoma sp. PAMC 29798]
MSKVGYRRGQAADLSRENWAGTGPRPLSWTAWYPTEAEQPEEEVSLGREGAAWMTMGKVVTQGELRRQTEPFPVVLMSHGTGGSAADLGWLGIRLAAKGFVVLGVDHHGNTAVEPFRPEGFLCWWERARDLSVVLDLLAELEPFQGRLDFGKVFAAGFSLGGYTVLSLGGAITHMRLFSDWMTARGITRGPREFPDIASHVAPLLERSRVFRASWERPSQSYRDARVKAILSCAPAPTVRAFSNESLRDLTLPVSLIVGGADTEAPAEDCAYWLDERLPNRRLVLLGPDVGHAIFLCEATALGRTADPIACLDAVGVDRRAIHDDVAARAIALFRI